MRSLERHVCILLNEQNGHSFFVYLFDDTENLSHNQRGQAEGWLIHHHNLRAAHQCAAYGQHLLFATGECTACLPFTLPQTGKQIENPLHILGNIVFSQVGTDL